MRRCPFPPIGTTDRLPGAPRGGLGSIVLWPVDANSANYKVGHDEPRRAPVLPAEEVGQIGSAAADRPRQPSTRDKLPTRCGQIWDWPQSRRLQTRAVATRRHAARQLIRAQDATPLQNDPRGDFASPVSLRSGSLRGRSLANGHAVTHAAHLRPRARGNAFAPYTAASRRAASRRAQPVTAGTQITKQ